MGEPPLTKEEEKKKLYESLFLEKKFKERLDMLEKQKDEYRIKHEALDAKYKEDYEVQNSLILSLQEEGRQLSSQKVKAEAQCRLFELQIAEMQESHKGEIERIAFKHKKDLEAMEIEKNALRSKLSEMNEFIIEKGQIEAKMRKLEQTIEEQAAKMKRELEDLELEKIKATEKLRRDMLYKLKETKQNLLALNDEQLHTTTRLTVLENHRLTTELEYQSKQTEKLMLRNSKLEEQVVTLKRDIEIHKQVESELAKRSHFCQKLIKRLNAKVKQLEDDATNQTKLSQSLVEEPEPKQRYNEDLVHYLEQKLEEQVTSMTQLQTEYTTLKEDYKELRAKLNERSQKYRTLAVLLSNYLQDLKNFHPSLLEEQVRLPTNISNILSTPFEELNVEDRASLVTLLLVQLKPFMSEANLSSPESLKLGELSRSGDVSPSLPRIPGAGSGTGRTTQVDNSDADSRSKLYPRRPENPGRSGASGNARRGIASFKAAVV